MSETGASSHAATGLPGAPCTSEERDGETERKSSPFVFSVLFEGVGSGGVLAEVGPAAGAGGPHGCCALLELQIRFRHWIEGVEAVEAMATAGAATDTGSLECLGCNAVKSSLLASPPFFGPSFGRIVVEIGEIGAAVNATGAIGVRARRVWRSGSDLYVAQSPLMFDVPRGEGWQIAGRRCSASVAFIGA